jgi:hypothetical protein
MDNRLVEIREYLNKQNMFGIRNESWNKIDAINFFSRQGIELVFEEDEAVRPLCLGIHGD